MSPPTTMPRGLWLLSGPWAETQRAGVELLRDLVSPNGICARKEERCGAPGDICIDPREDPERVEGILRGPRRLRAVKVRSGKAQERSLLNLGPNLSGLVMRVTKPVKLVEQFHSTASSSKRARALSLARA